MKLINIDEYNKAKKLNLEKKCEVCILNKQHRIFNYKKIRFNLKKKITRKKQRFHIDIADEENIIRIFKKMRYVIIFINDFIDYI